MDHNLLPVANEAPRCSEFARTLRLLPPGTGLFLQRVILVAVPLPWPKPALKHEWLVGAAAAVAASDTASRLFAAEPIETHPTVEVFERHGAIARGYRWNLSDPAQITELVSSIAKAPVGDLGATAVEVAAPQRAEFLPPTFLICTQGSHDSCCGSSGVALADELEASRDYDVRRVSHTGGHRFSPTFLAFPEGRMWAFADLALVDRIATATATATDHVDHARGWWGAKVGPEQAAECAVRSALATEPFQAPAIEPFASESGYAVTVGDRRWHVDVEVGRVVPSISCEAPGGLPAKPGREFKTTVSELDSSDLST